MWIFQSPPALSTNSQAMERWSKDETLCKTIAFFLFSLTLIQLSISGPHVNLARLRDRAFLAKKEAKFDPGYQAFLRQFFALLLGPFWIHFY